MIFLNLLLLLTQLAISDTGSDLCPIFNGIQPDELVAFSNTDTNFWVEIPEACEAGFSCTWMLDEDGGSLSATQGFSVGYAAPPDYPEDCVPEEFAIYVTCVYQGSQTFTDTVTIAFQCTPEQRDELMATASSSVSGGGCSSAPTAYWVFFLPFGLFGARRRLRFGG